jgi:hypothetical protein
MVTPSYRGDMGRVDNDPEVQSVPEPSEGELKADSPTAAVVILLLIGIGLCVLAFLIEK